MCMSAPTYLHVYLRLQVADLLDSALMYVSSLLLNVKLPPTPITRTWPEMLQIWHYA